MNTDTAHHRALEELRSVKLPSNGQDNLPLEATDLLPEPEVVARETVHRLDSPASRDRLRQYGLVLSPEQGAVFHALQTRWRCRVVAEETGRCIVENRFNQQSLDNYFRMLRVVYDLGPSVRMHTIVQELHRYNLKLSTLLRLAVVCGLFSDEFADEVWSLMRQWCQDKPEDDDTRELFETYFARVQARKLLARTRRNPGDPVRRAGPGAPL